MEWTFSGDNAGEEDAGKPVYHSKNVAFTPDALPASVLIRCCRRAGPTLLVLALVLASAGCNGRILGKQYEYEEDLYLALDGSATLTINASIASFAALRGLDLDVSPSTRASREVRDKIRAAYQSPVTEVTRVSPPWRRAGRPFVQIRLKTSDVRRLAEVPALSWSRYELTAQGDQHTFRQTVGASALRRGTLQNVGWTGSEIVAFRLHLPSRIREHNARDLETNETLAVARGNILGWEQRLPDRLEGTPVAISVTMDSESILRRTLLLFGGAFAAALAVLGLLIWFTMRKGRKAGPTMPVP